MFANPNIAASRGYVDAVIDYADARDTLARSLESIKNKRKHSLPKKHGNIAT